MRTDDGIHEHSGDKRKTEIIVYPDGGIGFCCFSDECTLGELIAKVNELKGERYPHKIFEEQPVGELLEALGAVVDDGAEFLGDLTGKICTRWNERESTWRKSGISRTLG
jgi:hypothetical protein